MESLQEVNDRTFRALEEQRLLLEAVRASIERCEALPKITTERLLNLPVAVGRVVE